MPIDRIVNTAPYRWWDAAPALAELRDLRDYRRARALHQRLWDGGWTMLGSRRGRALRRLAASVHGDGVPGALVDCGAWNGGSSILMADAAPDRPVWVFDSFQGLPAPSELDGAASADYVGACVGSEDKVREGFAVFGGAERLHVRPGWFADTLPAAAGEIGPIALLHCDGDWYDSVKLTLDTFYDQVSPGGYVVIDDYGAWPGAARAAEECRRAAGERSRLHMVDHTGRWWRKPPLAAT
jgi:O-methyltransferase